MAEGYSIKLRFGSLEEAIDWFQDARHDGLVGPAGGLRLQGMRDLAPPDEDIRLIVSDVEGDPHPWIVEPAQPTKAST